MTEVCKICKDGKPYRRLDIHVMKFHNMKMEEYNNYNSNELEEVELKKPIKQKDIVNNIFNGKPTESLVDQPLKVFLKEFNLTEKELRSVVKNYIDGKPIPLEQSIKMNEARGLEEANRLKHSNTVQTSNLHTAEALEKHYGFKCIAVRSARGTIPKIWELEKIK